MDLPKVDIVAQMNTLEEDLKEAAQLAIELHQGPIAVIIYCQLSAMTLARTGERGREDIHRAVDMMYKMAEACCRIIEEGLASKNRKGESKDEPF